MKKQDPHMNDPQKHQLPVDVDALWAAIEPEVDQINTERKKKRRFFFFWMIGLGLVLSAIALWSIQTGKINDPNISLQEQAQPTLPTEGQDLTTNAAKTSDQEEIQQSITDEQETTSADDPEEETSMALISPSNSDNPKTEESSSIDASAIIQSGRTQVQKQQTQKPLDIQQVQPKTANTPSIFTTTDDTNQPKPNDSDASKQADSALDIPQSTSFSTEPKLALENVDNPVDKGVNTNPSEGFGVESEDQSPSYGLDDDRNFDAFSTIPKEKIEKFEFNSKDSDDKLDELKPTLVDCCPNQATWCFSILPQIGWSAPFRTLDSTITDQANQTRLDLRETHETTLEVLSGSILAQVRHQSGFSLSSGIQFSQLTERYRNQETVVELDSIEGVRVRVVQLSGDTLDFRGMVPRTTTSTFNRRIYNRYQLLDIPIIIGYERAINDWKIGAQVGVLANLSLSTQGKVLDSPTTELDLGDQQDQIFKSQIGLSYHAGLTVSRVILPGLEIQANPHIRIIPGDWTVDAYSLSQQYRFVGMNVGLRWTIGE